MRKSPVNKDTWDEFVVTIYQELGDKKFEIPMCGLCGNNGILAMSGLKSPAGHPIPPARGYCICPNGRAMKYTSKK